MAPSRQRRRVRKVTPMGGVLSSTVNQSLSLGLGMVLISSNRPPPGTFAIAEPGADGVLFR